MVPYPFKVILYAFFPGFRITKCLINIVLDSET